MHMSASAHIDSLMPQHIFDKVEKDGDLSFTAMKSMLQKAESRLTGSASLHTQSSASSVDVVKILPHRIADLDSRSVNDAYITFESGIARMDPHKSVDDNERKLVDRARVPTVIGNAAKITQAKVSRSTAGSDWFHLPRTILTPELKRDLQLLSMRSTWDPKRHYKKDSRKPLIPEYSQIGTIMQGPTEHFSSRIAKRDRKKTFVEEITAAEGANGRFKKKSTEIQASKTSGRRAFYQKLKQKRSKRSIRP
ncbi:MAG: hypothetical protein Q9180_000019 [Flavoplaca navasiana]